MRGQNARVAANHISFEMENGLAAGEIAIDAMARSGEAARDTRDVEGTD